MKCDEVEIGLLIDSLEIARNNRAWLRHAVPCPRCKAQPGEPCRRPSGATIDSDHAPRMDLRIRAYNRAPVRGWRIDLIDCGAREVLRKIERSKLYKLALRDGWVG